MLRSILYQLISSHRELGLSLPVPTIEAQVWTIKRLTHGIRTVLSQNSSHFKVCVVLDGLDEFEGDAESQEQLTSFILDTLQGTNVKTVLSSRPEPFLMDVFGSHRGLRLQDLTGIDLREYVDGKLLGFPRMKRFQEESSVEVDALCSRICEKAEGVFMWVRLAVQEMIAGLRARDTLQLLQKRFELLDHSMDALFAQLLARIHPVVSLLLIHATIRHRSNAYSV